MKRSFKAYHTNISFIDLLFNTVLGFAVFFTICFILMTIHRETEIATKTKAEFLIVLTWDSNDVGRADDIDLWVQDPLGDIVFFRDKSQGLMHLDRDDLGDTNDTILTADGREILVTTNQEIATIRGFIEGEWTINVHMYSKKIKESANVEVRIDKLNPSYQSVVHDKFTMTTINEEKTIIRFTMSNEGKILSIDKTPKKLVELRLYSDSSMRQ